MNNRAELNRNLAQMLKGGVIMDVTTPEQAKIAGVAGGVAAPADAIPALISENSVSFFGNILKYAFSVTEARLLKRWRCLFCVLK